VLYLFSLNISSIFSCQISDASDLEIEESFSMDEVFFQVFFFYQLLVIIITIFVPLSSMGGHCGLIDFIAT